MYVYEVNRFLLTKYIFSWIYIIMYILKLKKKKVHIFHFVYLKVISSVWKCQWCMIACCTQFKSFPYITFLHYNIPHNFSRFPYASAGKESTCSVGDLGLIPGLERSPGEWIGYPIQYPGLENYMDCIVHGVAKSWTRLSHFHFTSLLHIF